MNKNLTIFQLCKSSLSIIFLCLPFLELLTKNRCWVTIDFLQTKPQCTSPISQNAPVYNRNVHNSVAKSHTMDLLWEKFQWILPLCMTPISFQSKASVVCSVTEAIFIDFCLKKLNVFSQHIDKKTNEYLNSADQVPRNWNVDQLPVLVISWDITKWCSINLLWKEFMERMSEHTGLISSYQLLITAVCTNTGDKMKSSHSRAADRCPFVHRHSLNQVTSFMQSGMLWCNMGYFSDALWHFWDKSVNL